MSILYKRLVRQILEENPSARASDDVLFAEVLKRIGTSLSPSAERAVIEAFSGGLGGIKYDSVRRSRQKIQEAFPGLQPPDGVISRRKRRSEQIVTELYRGGE